MKRSMYTKIGCLMLLLAAVLCSSCEKVFPNPKLDNFWKLDKVSFLSGSDFQGATCQEKEYMGVFWGFARDLIEVENHNINFGSHGIITDCGDSLKVDFSMYSQVQGYDMPKLLLSIQSCGISTYTTTYRIIRMDKKKLILEDNVSRLEFTRW